MDCLDRDLLGMVLGRMPADELVFAAQVSRQLLDAATSVHPNQQWQLTPRAVTTSVARFKSSEWPFNPLIMAAAAARQGRSDVLALACPPRPRYYSVCAAAAEAHQWSTWCEAIKMGWRPNQATREYARLHGHFVDADPVPQFWWDPPRAVDPTISSSQMAMLAGNTFKPITFEVQAGGSVHLPRYYDIYTEMSVVGPGRAWLQMGRLRVPINRSTIIIHASQFLHISLEAERETVQVIANACVLNHMDRSRLARNSGWVGDDMFYADGFAYWLGDNPILCHPEPTALRNMTRVPNNLEILASPSA